MPEHATEPSADRAVLLDFCADQHRAVLGILEGLTDDEVRSTPWASVMSIGGIVQHLGYVERWWYSKVFEGADVELPWSDADRDADFRLADDMGVNRLNAFYLAEVQRADIVIAGASFDDVARHPKYPLTLRWIVVHMLEETARHLGHLDLMRETVTARR